MLTAIWAAARPDSTVVPVLEYHRERQWPRPRVALVSPQAPVAGLAEGDGRFQRVVPELPSLGFWPCPAPDL